MGVIHDGIGWRGEAVIHPALLYTRTSPLPPSAHAPKDLPIPAMPATQSGGKRPPDPEHAGHPSERSDAGVIRLRLSELGGIGLGAWTLLSV